MDTVRKSVCIQNTQNNSPIYLDTQVSVLQTTKFQCSYASQVLTTSIIIFRDIRLQYTDQIKMNHKCIRYNLDQNASH